MEDEYWHIKKKQRDEDLDFEIFRVEDLSPERQSRLKPIKMILLEASYFYGAALTDQQITMWANVLSKHDPEIIRKALVDLTEKKTQVFMPKPGEIMSHVMDLQSKARKKTFQQKPVSTSAPECRLCSDEGTLTMIRTVSGKKYDYAFKCYCNAGSINENNFPVLDPMMGPPEWSHFFNQDSERG